MIDAQAYFAETMTEEQLLQAVRYLARANGYESYHTHDSRRSDAGFPDLVLLRGGCIIFAELKSEKGAVRKQQRTWLTGLRAVEGNIRERRPRRGPALFQVFVWKPSDLISGAIEKALA